MLKDFEYISSNTDVTIDLGKIFSKQLKPGDVIGFNGDLGSGKTTFIKGILEGLNYRDNVTSPTFTLINEYDADYKVLHVDFFRENNIKRWKNIGFEEMINKNDIILIEWSNLIPKLLPEDIHILDFEHLNFNQRKISLK
jgi:tRNA threonylcarbamoyladenosine biosynthesis protein TsaE